MKTGPRKNTFTVGKKVLLQTLVDAPLAKRVEAAARREGISNAAFLRRMLIHWAQKPTPDLPGPADL